MRLFACGCCCQVTTTKSIPLDKIQDIELISDCCGDTCGWVHEAGRPYKLHVQTAGMSGPEGGAELTVFCVSDPEGLRARVLAAKRGLMDRPASASTAAYGPASSQPLSSHSFTSGVAVNSPIMPPVATQQVVAVLERIERALNEGLADMRRERVGATASGFGTGAAK